MFIKRMNVHKVGFILFVLLLTISNGMYQNFFVSAETGVSLAVAVHNIPGYDMPQDGGTIAVVLFDSNYQKITEKSNEYKGGETLVNVFLGAVPPANYIVEVYNIPKAGLRYHEFWGSGFIKADGEPKHFYRHVPYVIDIRVNGKSIYEGVTTIILGESVSIEVLVKNADPGAKDVKVMLFLRKSGSTSYWFQEVSNQKSISGNGIDSFRFVINPQEVGIHEVYVVVYGWNNAKIITDQHNWYEAFEVKTPEIEDAEIIKFKPPTGEFKPGEEIISDVMIKNTGTVTRSFWVGLSYRSPDGTWYDVPPKETSALSPGQETTITFRWRLPADASYGFYDARAAVWNGYDPNNNIMLSPKYDEAYAEDVFEVIMPSHNVEVQLISPKNGEIIKDLPITLIVRVLVDGSPAKGVRVELTCTNGGTSYCHPIDGEKFHYTDSDGYVRVQCFSSLGPGSTVKWYAKALYQGEEYRSETRSFTYLPEIEELEVDIYTDKGGQGRSVPGGTYYVGEYGEVYFKANRRAYVYVYEEYPSGTIMLYEGWIEGNKVYSINGRYQEPPGDRLFVIKAEDEYGNEAYDECRVEVTSQTPYLSDLTITSVKIYNSKVYRGEKLTIEFTEKNEGEGNSGNFITSICLGHDKYRCNYVIGTTDEHSLKAGESHTVKFDLLIPREVPPGRYYVTAFVDYSNEVEESNEDNNIISAIDSVIIKVRTVLTFYGPLPSSEVGLGDLVVFKGRLTTSDTGEGVAGAEIKIFDEDPLSGVFGGADLIAKGTTDESGFFEIRWFVIPMDMDWDIEAYAKFDGNEFFGPSISNKYNIMVFLGSREPPIEVPTPVSFGERLKVTLCDKFESSSSQGQAEALTDTYVSCKNEDDLWGSISLASRAGVGTAAASGVVIHGGTYTAPSNGVYRVTFVYAVEIAHVYNGINPEPIVDAVILGLKMPLEKGLKKVLKSLLAEAGEKIVTHLGSKILNAIINPKTAGARVRLGIYFGDGSGEPRWITIYSKDQSSSFLENKKDVIFPPIIVESLVVSLEKGKKYSFATMLQGSVGTVGVTTVSANTIAIKGRLVGVFIEPVEKILSEAGDITGDGIVDYKDLAVLGASYGKHEGDPDFSPLADLNNDGVVDYKDLAILGANYEKS